MIKREEEDIRADERRRWVLWLDREAAHHYGNPAWYTIIGIAECIQKNRMVRKLRLNTSAVSDQSTGLSTKLCKNK
jgi:hypothetical protein